MAWPAAPRAPLHPEPLTDRMFSRELQRTLTPERPEERAHVRYQQVVTRDGYPGSDRGSPNRGSTLVSKRVIVLTRSPARVSTISPFACSTGVCRSRT